MCFSSNAHAEYAAVTTVVLRTDDLQTERSTLWTRGVTHALTHASVGSGLAVRVWPWGYGCACG